MRPAPTATGPQTAPAPSASHPSSDADELQPLRLALDASGGVIFITDASGTFVYVNAQFVRTYGHEPSEVIGVVRPGILKSGLANAEDYRRFWKCLRRNQIVAGGPKESA